MRKEYDFSNAMPNPYIKKLRKQIAVKIDTSIVDYFKASQYIRYDLPKSDKPVLNRLYC